MFKLSKKLLTGAALATVLLAGCGGDSGGDGPVVVGPPNPPPPMQQTITAVVDYIRDLIASASGKDEPTAINNLTLVANDTAEPAAIN